MWLVSRQWAWVKPTQKPVRSFGPWNHVRMSKLSMLTVLTHVSENVSKYRTPKRLYKSPWVWVRDPLAFYWDRIIMTVIASKQQNCLEPFLTQYLWFTKIFRKQHKFVNFEEIQEKKIDEIVLFTCIYLALLKNSGKTLVPTEISKS